MQQSLLLVKEDKKGGSDKSHPDKYAVPGEDQIFWAPTDSALLVRMGYARLETEAPAEHFQASTIPPPRKSSAL